MADKITSTEMLEQTGGEAEPMEKIVSPPTGDHESRLKAIEIYLGLRQPPAPEKKKIERKLDTPEYRKSKEYR